MTSLFWSCLLLGGGIVLLQFAASLIGMEADVPDGEVPDSSLGEGMQLLSVRAVAAAVAFFGLGGLGAQRLGLPLIAAVPVGLIAGVAAAVSVAAAMRGMRRLEGDQTFRLSNTVGHSGEVYLGIPGQRSGMGKIHITIQERLMELEAITPDDELPTGTRVLVIDTIAPATVIVVPQPRILDEGEGDA